MNPLDSWKVEVFEQLPADIAAAVPKMAAHGNPAHDRPEPWLVARNDAIVEAEGLEHGLAIIQSNGPLYMQLLMAAQQAAQLSAGVQARTTHETIEQWGPDAPRGMSAAHGLLALTRYIVEQLADNVAAQLAPALEEDQ